jgi:hypothetical protein
VVWSDTAWSLRLWAVSVAPDTAAAERSSSAQAPTGAKARARFKVSIASVRMGVDCSGVGGFGSWTPAWSRTLVLTSLA